MAVPQLQQAFTLGGNTPTEKMILGVMIAKIRSVIYNENSTIAFRATKTAENISFIAGIGTAIYQLVERLVWGATYDNNLGAPDQTTAGLTTSLNIDQYLTIKWHVEEFDTQRLMNSTPAQLATFMAGWAESMTKNLLANLEAVFIRGVYDYCIAKLPDPDLEAPMVLKMDMSNAVTTTPQQAEDMFYIINNTLIQYRQYVDETIFGTNEYDWDITMGYQAYATLSKAYTKIINIVSAETIATGKLYKSEVLGTTVATNWYMQNKPFIHTSKRKINLDIDFDFSKLQAVGVHRATWAMPISFQSIRQVINPNTGNLQWNGKCMFASPEALYKLVFIILKEYPTSAEILAAQARVHPNTGTTDQSKNLTYTFQLALYDNLVAPVALSTVATKLALGAITTGGGAPTVDAVKTAFINANPTVNPEFITVGTPTTTGATITGTSIYTGTVNVTFTVSEVQLPPTPASEIAQLTQAITNAFSTLTQQAVMPEPETTTQKGKG